MFRDRPWNNRKSSQVSSYVVRGYLCYLRSRLEFAKLRAKEKEKTPEYKSAMHMMAMGSVMLNFDEMCKQSGFKKWVPPHKEEVKVD